MEGEEWDKEESKPEGTSAGTWPGFPAGGGSLRTQHPSLEAPRSREEGWDRRVLLPPCGSGEDYSCGD